MPQYNYFFDKNQNFVLLQKIMNESVILSENIKMKFFGLMLTASQQSDNKAEEMLEESQKFHKELSMLRMFNTGYLIDLFITLNNGIQFEINKRKGK